MPIEDAYGSVAAPVPPATASQTVGPYWHLLADPALADLTRFGAVGDRMELTGRVFDGDGLPVTDACVEIWQPSPGDIPQFDGWGRSETANDGRFRFVTLKPGPVAGRGNALQAPHVAVTIFARGLLHHIMTRAYFAGEPLNDTDPLLGLVEDPDRRATLLAHPGTENQWVFDIHMQGPRETVFLEI